MGGGTDATDFPKTEGPSLSGLTDAFVAKLNSGSAISYARLLGGADFDQAEGIAIQPGCSRTLQRLPRGRNFFHELSDHHRRRADDLDLFRGGSFVTELSADGNSTVYSTLLEPATLRCSESVTGLRSIPRANRTSSGRRLAEFGLRVRPGTAPRTQRCALEFGPPPPPAPGHTQVAPTNGSPLTIQNGSGTTTVGTTTGNLCSTDGVSFPRRGHRISSGPVPAFEYDPHLTPNWIFAGTASGLLCLDRSRPRLSLHRITGTTKPVEFVVDSFRAPRSATPMFWWDSGHSGLWSSTNGGGSFTQVASIPCVGNGFRADLRAEKSTIPGFRRH